MGYATTAELQVVLEGVALPATRRELLAYAQSQDAEERLLAALRDVPEREYGYLDEVGEELARVQPGRQQPQPETPREESDAVPGGPEYARVPDDTGQVRDVEQGVEQQKQLG